MALKTLESLPPLREVIACYDLMARKSLGQHFLCDLNLTRRIAAAAGDLKGKIVYEVGPGPGGLTRALLETNAKKIIVLEKDTRCVEALAELKDVARDRLLIVSGDALKIDLKTLTEDQETPAVIVANLPYNIGTELLIRWLHDIGSYESMTLMFQTEVVDRLVAEPDQKAYGRLSVITQFCCDITRVMDIPAKAFTPPPKIDSSVVHLKKRQKRPPDIRLKTLERVTAAAFGQRRKMLRGSLKSIGGEELLRLAGLNPQLRAENLSLEDFEKLSRCLETIKS